MELIGAIAYAIAKGVTKAVLESLPEIREAWTPKAREAAADPERQAKLEDARQAAISDGTLPPPGVG